MVDLIIAGTGYSRDAEIAAAQSLFVSSMYGRKLFGMPYIPGKQDCSNLVRQALNNSYGVGLQGITTQQAQSLMDHRALDTITPHSPVILARLQIGDLIYMNLGENDSGLIVPLNPNDMTRHVMVVAGVNQNGQIMVAHATGREGVEKSIIEPLPEEYVQQITHVAYGFLERQKDIVTDPDVHRVLEARGYIFTPEQLRGQDAVDYANLHLREYVPVVSQAQGETVQLVYGPQQAPATTLEAQEWFMYRQQTAVMMQAPDVAAYYMPPTSNMQTDAFGSTLTTLVFMARAMVQTVGHMVQDAQHSIQNFQQNVEHRIDAILQRGPTETHVDLSFGDSGVSPRR